MCGIAGFLSSRPLSRQADQTLAAMTDAIAHRGPDDKGRWTDEHAGIGLGHRRLSIVDLSPAGHQPMHSADGNLVIVFNGEIYNYLDLRRELEAEGRAPPWRGHSDTEALLAGIDAWGLPATLARCNGMFAFALWDRRDRSLTLVRDRAGEKPLFYGLVDDDLVFASELKAITAHPRFTHQIDRVALGQFMHFGYIPAPRSIFAGIGKLPPAHFLTVRAGETDPAPTCYWDLSAIAESGAADPMTDTPDLADEVEALLRDSVALRMVADVPLGTFLSGGIDSSLITALMQTQAERPVRTFSIGFSERNFDEAVHAKAVARHLGTDHAELYVGEDDVLSLLPRLPAIADEPFADASLIPTFIVSRMAREHVTVALSGDGGDELFGGYNRHVSASAIVARAAVFPAPLRRGAGALLAAPLTGALAERLVSVMPARYRVAGLAERLPKLGKVIGAASVADAYGRLTRQWDGVGPALGAGTDLGLAHAPHFDDASTMMMYLDAATYLPGDILAKVDRAGMAASLEGRIPFLDHRVMELAWRVPLSAKIRGGKGKHILRQILYRHVPPALIDRPKAGFAIPIGAWLTGSLRDWVEPLIDPARLRAEGYLDAAMVADVWQRFQAGARHLLPQLWCVLMFQAWLDEQAKLGSAAPVEQRRRAA